MHWALTTLEDFCAMRSTNELKVAESQKVFYFGSNLPKNVPNHYPEHLFFKRIVLRKVIWHLFLEI